MKTSKLKKIIYGIGISLFFSQGFLNIACSDWTDIEAKDYHQYLLRANKALLWNP